MNKKLRTALLLIVVGGAIMLISFMLLLRRGIYFGTHTIDSFSDDFDWKSSEYNNDNQYPQEASLVWKKTFKNGDIDDIVVRLVKNGFIVIVKSSADNDVHVSLFRYQESKEEPTMSLNGRKLKIQCGVTDADTQKNTYDFFLFKRKRKINYKIIVELPKEKQLGICDIQNAIGIVNLDTIHAENFTLTVGAGKSSAQNIQCKNLELITGAGMLYLENSVSSQTDIKSGVSTIQVSHCELGNLNFEGGVGTFSFEGALNGNSLLKLGVGDANLKLKGGKNAYQLDIQHGLGGVFVDGKKFSQMNDAHIAKNLITAQCGIGTLRIDFTE